MWAEIGTWDITYYFRQTGVVLYEGEERCGFEIQYSRKRNKYRLKTTGSEPKNHHKYKIAVEKLNEYLQEQKYQQGPEGFDFKSDPTQ